MHDTVTGTKTEEKARLGTFMKANDRGDQKPCEPLFDAFWRSGELAVMFGPPGTGKSVMAVQIADALARGRAIGGFEMPTRRQRVLLIDMKLTKDQFDRRYAIEYEDGGLRYFRHSENLSWGRPDDPDDLCEYIREFVVAERISVVVIDDASELRSTFDGTREMLRTMRKLRRLQRELGISVMVIASSREPGRFGLVTERELMRSRVLCDTADSAFAFGVHPNDPAWRYLLQTRSRTGEIVWTDRNMPYCRMEQSEDGFLGFVFDQRFLPQYPEDVRQQIVVIKKQHDAGAPFRWIAEDEGMSLSRVYRLYKLWRPDLEREEDKNLFEQADHAENSNSHYSVESEIDYTSDTESSTPYEEGVPVATYSVGTDAGSFVDAAVEEFDRSILIEDWPDWIGQGLTPELDEYGNEMLVESRDERGRPKVYYRLTSKGDVRRWIRNGWGVSGSAVDPPHSRGWLPTLVGFDPNIRLKPGRGGPWIHALKSVATDI